MVVQNGIRCGRNGSSIGRNANSVGQNGSNFLKKKSFKKKSLRSTDMTSLHISILLHEVQNQSHVLLE